MKNVIFYFSGTGNSLQVAKDIADKIGDCELINIPKYNLAKEVCYERVGFVFPVYYFGLPNIVRGFLNEIKIGNNPYIFSVATCGGNEGAVHTQVSNLLYLGNKSLHSAYTIIMPSNYIVSYKIPSIEKQNYLLSKAKIKIDQISKVVINKEKIYYELSRFSLVRLISNIVYNIYSPKFKNWDRKFHVNNECNSCGKCQKVCSVKNISIEKGKPVWNHNCEFCLACIQHCPMKAINYKNKTQKRNRYINPNIQIVEKIC